MAEWILSDVVGLPTLPLSTQCFIGAPAAALVHRVGALHFCAARISDLGRVVHEPSKRMSLCAYRACIF